MKQDIQTAAAERNGHELARHGLVWKPVQVFIPEFRRWHTAYPRELRRKAGGAQ